MEKNRTIRWLLSAQSISLVVIAVLIVQLTRPSSTPNNQYPLLAKRIFVENPNDIIIDFNALRSDLKQYLASAGLPIGFYFEYLPNGNSINIEGNTDFYRASLVKLPIVMRAYKYVEQGRLSLDEKLTLEEKQIDKNFGDFWKRGIGAQATVRELITLVLQKSDNTAFNVLYEKVNVQLAKDTPDGDKSADDVYEYLDIPFKVSGITPMVTAKNYSSILKSLYFSAYLSYQHSQEILEILTGQHSEEWMRASIPTTVKVANKIGVYDSHPDELHVFSDCGIVYLPLRQYILCTMIRTDDKVAAVPHLRTISKMVYDYVSKKRAARQQQSDNSVAM